MPKTAIRSILRHFGSNFEGNEQLYYNIKLRCTHSLYYPSMFETIFWSKWIWLSKAAYYFQVKWTAILDLEVILDLKKN